MKPNKKILSLSRHILPVIAFFVSVLNANALTYYSRVSGNWNSAASWSLIGYGGVATVLFPTANDTAKVGNGYTITINTSSACARLDIGQGASGIVQYSNASNYTLTVSGNITVNTGATLIYSGNGSKTHILQVGGSISNSGTIDLYSDANDIVNLSFNTSSTSTVSGNGTWALNNVTLSKSFSTSIVDVQSSAFETAIAILTVTTGTYIHDNSGTYSVNSSVASDFAITQNAVFKIQQGTVSFSPNSNRTYLYGSLYVDGGTVTIGTSAGTYGLRYDKVGTNVPYLEISSGSMTVYGGITNASGAGSDPFSFRMTGGTMLLNSGSTGCSDEVFFVNDVASSSFYMSGGTITEQAPNTQGSPRTDWGICGDFGSVSTTGGTVQFGNASSGSNKIFTFIPFANAVQPNFEVAGPLASTITLCPYNPTTADFILLSLKINGGKVFDNRSYVGTAGDNKKMTLVSEYDGIHAFYNDGSFLARMGNVELSGTETQIIGGSVVTAFYDLTISNSNGVILGIAENISDYLNMNSGVLSTTSTNIITCLSTANANIGSATSYVDGPMIHTVASTSLSARNFPLGKGSDYRPAILSVTHNTVASVTYKGEMFNISATSLGYGLPSTINKVSYTRYWNFDRANVANLTSANMTLYYDLDDTVTDRLRVAVVHDDGASRWVNYGGTGSANNTGNITSNAITSFKNKFALGFPPSPLPVNLISFAVKKSFNEVQCDWETASEINNNYFTVERSADGLMWTSIGTLKGAGNSTVVHAYRFADRMPLNGDSYYRLKQTDFDGASKYSDAEHIFFAAEVRDFVFYPNPSKGIVHVKKPNEQMTNVNAIVQDMNGKQVPATVSLSPDSKELIVDFGQNTGGANDSYIINLISSGEIVKEKVLIEK
jgi:hypothetical protein